MRLVAIISTAAILAASRMGYIEPTEANLFAAPFFAALLLMLFIQNK